MRVNGVSANQLTHAPAALRARHRVSPTTEAALALLHGPAPADPAAPEESP